MSSTAPAPTPVTTVPLYRHSLSRKTPPELPPSDLPAAPEGTERIFIDSLGGRLELLQSRPPEHELNTPSAHMSSNPNLLFLPGAFGSAAAFANFLRYFSNHGYNSFSLSYRGHGNSYYPSYLRMVYIESLSSLTEDAINAAKYIKETTGNPDLVLLGHSAGGGIAQYILTHDLLSSEKNGINVIALCNLAPIPSFGSVQMYKNWLKVDPWMLVRMFFRDLSHPRSPFSNTELVRRNWFSEECEEKVVVEVERGMSEYDSARWAFDMFLKFADTDKIVRNISSKVKKKEVEEGGEERLQDGEQNVVGEGEELGFKNFGILIVAAEKDKSLTVSLMEKLCAEYKASWKRVSEEIMGTDSVDVEERVKILVVRGSGHDLMRDVAWVECCNGIREWLANLLKD